MKPPTDQPEPVMLIIADISGYTRYMTANAKTLAHSQSIITELVESIIEQVQVPLEVAKLEGDAIFLFCRKHRDAVQWNEIRAEISRRLLAFFQCFHEKLKELGRSNICSCHACAHIEKLRLKIVVHSGVALFHRVLHFNELAGTDVIMVHRLLKNSVKAAQYLLLTEAAMRELEFPETMDFKSGAETYEEFGSVKTAVHDFNFDTENVVRTSGKSFAVRYRETLRFFLKLWFGPLASRRGTFHHLPDNSSQLAKACLAVLVIVLTPIVVPAAAFLIVFHVLKNAG
jgi:Protein of unknown function (DUF2652)